MLEFDSRLTRLLSALSDPTRRVIVERLAVAPLTVSEIAAQFDISLAAILQHLQILEQAGAIRTFKDGRVRHCLIDANGLCRLKNWILDQERSWQSQFAAMEADNDAANHQKET